jgi:hypothetical protein
MGPVAPEHRQQRCHERIQVKEETLTERTGNLRRDTVSRPLVLLVSAILCTSCSSESTALSEPDADVAVNDLIDRFNDEMLNDIEAYWQPAGYWSTAQQESDNQYQETILFYALMHRYYEKGSEARVISAMNFSLENLRSADGAFFQDGQVSFMRSAMFLGAAGEVLQTLLTEPEQREVFLNAFEPSVRWLGSSELGVPLRGHFSGNQALGALLAFRSFHSLTGRDDYGAFWSETRQELIDRFIHEDSETGFWQEAPDSWGARRLNIPYLQVQAQLLGYYLLENPADTELLALFTKLANRIDEVLDVESLTLDVRESNSFDGVQTEVPLVAPAILWLGSFLCDCFPSFSAADEEDILGRGYLQYRQNVVKDLYVTLFTDAVYRVAIIKGVLNRRP